MADKQATSKSKHNKGAGSDRAPLETHKYAQDKGETKAQTNPKAHNGAAKAGAERSGEASAASETVEKLSSATRAEKTADTAKAARAAKEALKSADLINARPKSNSTAQASLQSGVKSEKAGRSKKTNAASLPPSKAKTPKAASSKATSSKAKSAKAKAAGLGVPGGKAEDAQAINKKSPGKAAGKTSPKKKKSAKSSPATLIRQYQLVDMVKAYDPLADEDLLNKAYVFSMRAHGGQTRKSGDPYFSHPLAVAAILTELRADPASVAAALLHDVVEDTDTDIEEIERLFGPEVAALVDGVTKLSQIQLKSEASKQAENFRKLVVAMADDVRVLWIKLADRLHNMRTLEHHQNEDKRRRIALETLEIYAPLAGRIGVQRFREELEDISFAVLNQDAYKTISDRLLKLQGAVVEQVVMLATALRDLLEESGIKADIYSREKRAYSIWKKMAAKNVSFDELADIYAFRILVPSIEDCYRALGLIHTSWRMIPEEFDDYISVPKPNGYRSIHTAVMGPAGPDGARQRVEVQIRTHEMHDAAERGVAAHWQYKDPGAQEGPARVEIVTPVQYDPYETPRRLVEMFQHGEDLDEALAYVKLELFQDQVFVFTPKGRVIALTKGATALDFAYAVHTDIGDSCVGAKVNNAQRPLRTPLKNGDVVQVLRSDNPVLPPDWEKIAITGKARTALRRRIKKMQHEEQISFGRRLAENVFSSVNLEFSEKAVREALSRLGQETVEDALAALGRGEFSAAHLLESAYPGAGSGVEGEIKTAGAEPFSPRQAIEGLPPGAMVLMGQCCTPVPGERIVGIRGHDNAVTVHTIYCHILERDDPEQSKWLDLKWRDDIGPSKAYTRITITMRNELGVLSEVAGIVARYGVSIISINMEQGGQDFVTIRVRIEVDNQRQLVQLLAGLRASASVLSAERNEVYDH